MSGFYTKIEKDTLDNDNLRKVLFTGKFALYHSRYPRGSNGRGRRTPSLINNT